VTRIRQKFKNWNNPINRWKLLLLGLLGCVIIFSGGYGILAFTNSPAFCANCHEMAPEYSTYTISTHKQISCVQCHIKPGFKNMALHKIKSLKEVYYHAIGAPNQIVQTEEEAVISQNCLQCHSKNRLVTASKDLKVNHNGHIEKGIPCITCHAGVVHAKITERGLNISEYLGYWTNKNTNKVMQEKYLKPNMGTCIDCHDKVNNGEKPWKDIAYSVPSNPEKPKNVTDKTKKVQYQKTQRIILQAISNPPTNVKISMKCVTCHKEVSIPKSHKNYDWEYNHKINAFKEVRKCLNCHQDSKWVKNIPKDDIVALFIMDRPKTKDEKNYMLVNQARKNQFCITCHSSYKPPSHSSGLWAEGHAWASNDDDEKLKCFVCHDNEKPQISLKYIKAPTDVYCQYCHKKGFSGILNGKIGD
jgi:nitrate/TMAO reductase-like tetraheme cytochrome c subunit